MRLLLLIKVYFLNFNLNYFIDLCIGNGKNFFINLNSVKSLQFCKENAIGNIEINKIFNENLVGLKFLLKFFI